MLRRAAQGGLGQGGGGCCLEMVAAVEDAPLCGADASGIRSAGLQEVAYEQLDVVIRALEIGVQLPAVVVMVDMVLPDRAVMGVGDGRMQKHHGERQYARSGYEPPVSHRETKIVFIPCNQIAKRHCEIFINFERIFDIAADEIRCFHILFQP